WASKEEVVLVRGVGEIGQLGQADRLETAFRIGYALDRPRRDRLGNTLDLVPPEVAQTEQIAEQPARGGGNDDRPGLGQGLKTGCKGRRLPDHSALAPVTRTAAVADQYAR